MRIGVASLDWAVTAPDAEGRPTWGGSGWYRCGMPAMALQHAGMEVVVGRLVGRDHPSQPLGVATWAPGGDTAEIVWDVDVLVMQRAMFADLPEKILRARAAGQVVVNDVDDHYWALHTANRAWTATHPYPALAGRVGRAERRARGMLVSEQAAHVGHYTDVLRASSRVVVSTPWLAGMLHQRLGGRVEIVVAPNCIDLARWEPWTTADHHAVGRHPTVGWVGATTHRSSDLEVLAGIIGPFIARNGLRFFHGGWTSSGADAAWLAGMVDPDTLAHLPDRWRADAARRVVVPVDREPMRPIGEYPHLFRHCHVGVVPLSSVPFNAAKSAVKGMEMAAAGVPFVASDSPAYRLLARLDSDPLWPVRHEPIGRVATRPGDWKTHLTALLDPVVRADEAARNREALRAFDVDREDNVARWLEAWTGSSRRRPLHRAVRREPGCPAQPAQHPARSSLVEPAWWRWAETR